MRLDTGLCVVHLFCKPSPAVDREAVVAAVKAAEANECQVLTAAIVGHKCDLAVMALSPDLRGLRQLQSGLQAAGLDVVDSYVSITEVSEYAKGMPAEMLQSRLYPNLPPDGMNAFCFYPMSKKRAGDDNWYLLDGPERAELMRDHGRTGRRYAGKVSQIVTGSMGLDDWEWGVTLFSDDPLQFKKLVYEMRFDEVSARYADFGPFYVGRRLRSDEIGRWLGE